MQNLLDNVLYYIFCGLLYVVASILYVMLKIKFFFDRLLSILKKEVVALRKGQNRQ